MTTVRWSASVTPPLVAAFAAAVHASWDEPDEEKGRLRFLESLRQMLGPQLYVKYELFALQMWGLQRRAPELLTVPPEWAWFQICPGCQSLRRTKFTRPQNGRIRLQLLRDHDWMQKRFEQGATYTDIARQLGCTYANVARFAEMHGLRSGKAARNAQLDEDTRRMHLAGDGPGTIAKQLDTSSKAVRKSLKRLGLANSFTGMVYHDPNWWRVRLERNAGSLRSVAREAGFAAPTARYWVKKYGLEHLVKKQRFGAQRRYPQLNDAVQLRELLERHDYNYKNAAAEVGCGRSLISWYAGRVLGIKMRELKPPHLKREWWTERLERGMTTAQLANEAGVVEKTVFYHLREFDLLGRALQNNPVQSSRRGTERKVANV